MSHNKTTADKIKYEISQIEKELEVIELLSMKLKISPLDSIELRAAAVSMQSIYNGYEKVLILTLKNLKCSIPTTQSWHSDLLLLSYDRKLISKNLESKLRDLMGFRHFVRHAYSFMLDNEQLEPLLMNMENLFNDFKAEIMGDKDDV